MGLVGLMGPAGPRPTGPEAAALDHTALAATFMTAPPPPPRCARAQAASAGAAAARRCKTPMWATGRTIKEKAKHPSEEEKKATIKAGRIHRNGVQNQRRRVGGPLRSYTASREPIRKMKRRINPHYPKGSERVPGHRVQQGRPTNAQGLQPERAVMCSINMFARLKYKTYRVHLLFRKYSPMDCTDGPPTSPDTFRMRSGRSLFKNTV